MVVRRALLFSVSIHKGRLVEGESCNDRPDEGRFKGDDGSGTEAKHVMSSQGVQQCSEVLDLATKPVEVAVWTAPAPPSTVGTNTVKLSDSCRASVLRFSDD